LNIRAGWLAARRVEVVHVNRSHGLSEWQQERVWVLWREGLSLRGGRSGVGGAPGAGAVVCERDRRGASGCAATVGAVLVG
jgi:hypothetical protein